MITQHPIYICSLFINNSITNVIENDIDHDLNDIAFMDDAIDYGRLYDPSTFRFKLWGSFNNKEQAKDFEIRLKDHLIYKFGLEVFEK